MSTDDPNSNGNTSKGHKIPPKDSLRAPLPKRFYKSVAVEAAPGGFRVLLDGRGIKTPAKREFVVPVEPLAEAIAAEWQAQGERIDPATMPLTKLANSAIDAVSSRMQEVADDIAAFSASDLLCYRAEAPEALVRRQAGAWDPVLAWAKRDLGADFRLRQGLMPIDQPPQALDAIRQALTGLDPLSLSALHVLTTISGSALLALAHYRGLLSVDEAWSAATVDETWQKEQWGLDAEAEAHAAARLAEFAAASRCLRLTRR